MKSKIILLVTSYCLLFTLTGCDAFVRKFTRKPKSQNISEEEMIVAPQEYKGAEMSRQEQYRQYFLFWRSWQDELIVSLQEKRSQKKQMDCIQEAIRNLENLRPLLNQRLQESLERYIEQEKALKDSIGRDVYGSNSSGNSSSAERIKRNILKDFSYSKIKDRFIEQP
ncbi:MAG: hypothetical protein ABIG31_04110 [Candidatus Omnitrophota bacterium]